MPTRQQDTEAALDELRATMRIAETAMENVCAAVQAARTAGTSWARIGAVFGISRQAAHKRFADR